MTAAQSFPCSNCGAKLAYDAATQAMACPFCNAKQAVAAVAPLGAETAGPVREISLEEGLRLAARGYGAPVTTLDCKDCGATVNVGEGERTTTCAFCGSAQVLAAAAGDPPIRPEAILPFRVPKDDATKRFSAWLAKLWFRPGDLKKIARVEEMGGVYVPFWTFDAQVASRWTAERGHHYYETESYRETVNGQSVERTRQVQRTRWEPAWGSRNDFFDDLLVFAGRALPENLVNKLSSFDTKQLVPYQPQFLSGWRAEQYAVDLPVAFDVAQQKIARVQEGRCGSDVGGDTHQGLSVTNEITRPTFKHVLLPVWIAAYRYKGKVYRFLVNGQTGEVVGVAPWSAGKIAATIAAVVLVIAGIVMGITMTQTASGPPPGATSTSIATPTAGPAAQEAPAEAVTTTPTQHTHPAPSASHHASHPGGPPAH